MMIANDFISKIAILLSTMEIRNKEKLFDIVVRLIGCDRNDSPYFI